MTIEEMKKAVSSAIDKNRDKIIAIGESIFREPELGFKEFKTAQKVKTVFEELGLSYKDGVARTGVIALMPGKEHKFNVAVMGELDAVVSPDHPFADPQTGAAHSCGHFAQIAAMLGVAYGLKDSGIMEELSGDVSFMAVPAEEGVELEWRSEMMEKGEISCLGGKQEFIKLGVFDNVDALLMQHSLTYCDTMTVGGGTSMGFIAKIVKYHGKQCHGATPFKGVNALDAARIGLTACDAVRTTFKDEDSVRFHPILTKGGELVNVVPGFAQIEAYVRANSEEALVDASTRLDRALKAGGDALGAKCEIINIPGYLFPVVSPELKKLTLANARELMGENKVFDSNGQCTTDANDVSNLIPTIHMMVGGARGVAHSGDYDIENPELSYIKAAKVLAMTVVDLLADGAKNGLNVKENYKAPHTKETYIKLLESIKNGERLS